MASSKLNHYGQHTLRLRSFRVDRYNVCNATQSKRAFIDDPAVAQQALDKLLPAPSLKVGAGTVPVVGAEIEWEKGQAQCVYYYEGLFPGTKVGEMYFELEGSDSHEPIETHPYFSQIGTKYSAQYDSNGQFTGFAKLIAGKPNPLYGASEYLSMGMTWRQTIISRDLPPALLQQVECVDVPPTHTTSDNITIAPPQLANGRNWLKLAPQARWRGNVWQIVNTWMASGRRGWNADVYRQL